MPPYSAPAAPAPHPALPTRSRAAPAPRTPDPPRDRRSRARRLRLRPARACLLLIYRGRSRGRRHAQSPRPRAHPCARSGWRGVSQDRACPADAPLRKKRARRCASIREKHLVLQRRVWQSRLLAPHDPTRPARMAERPSCGASKRKTASRRCNTRACLANHGRIATLFPKGGNRALERSPSPQPRTSAGFARNRLAGAW